MNNTSNTNAAADLNKYILNEFSDAKIIEQQLTVLKFRIGQEQSCKISSILAVLHQAKKDKLARDYSVTQASLDDVFVEFARLEREKQNEQQIDRVWIIIRTWFFKFLPNNLVSHQEFLQVVAVYTNNSESSNRIYKN